ncbi:MAG: putative Ig domain-containing protein [Gammaproteobacteria bacterium]|nr:putative Ig domain-containing protein [Gammaproteobacteria bacterium]
MIKRILTHLAFFLVLIGCQSAAATTTGQLFNIQGTGVLGGTAEITLCLNAKGILSCQNYTVQNKYLMITATAPHQVYPYAGIKVNTLPYIALDTTCTNLPNGFCMFSVDSQTPVTITITTTTVTMAATPSTYTEVGVAYSQTNVASGGTMPYTYTQTAGAVPAGTTLNASTGLVSGVPTTAGGFSYTITATDAQGLTAEALSSGTIASALSTSAPSYQTVFSGETATFSTTASGGTPSYTYQWQVNTGSGFANVTTGTGGQTSTYTTAALSSANNGNIYRVIVTDAATASVTSSGATLTVNSIWTLMNIDGSSDLASVSCPTPTFCMAVDTAGHAFAYNGTTWSAAGTIAVAALHHVNSVSCASPTYCWAVDSNGVGSLYTGTTWVPTVIQSGNSLTAVSCPTTSFCMAVDGTTSGIVWTLSGGTWTNIYSLANSLTSVSCTSSSFCMVVDNNGNADRFDGTTWTLFSRVSANQLTSVSCTPNSSSSCMAVDDSGDAYRYNGSSWSPFNPDGSTALTSVSCLGSAFCMAVDAAGGALSYNGASWSSVTSVDSGHAFNAVSCPTSSFCAAVDNSGNAWMYHAVAANVVVANLGTGSAPYNNPYALTFAVTDNGNVSPTYEVTGLSTPSNVFIDGNNNLWVVQSVTGTVYRFPASTVGSSSASVTLTSSAVTGVATDFSGNIYVSASNNAIHIYPETYQAPGVYTTPAPTTTISGASTGLDFPSALVLDSSNNIWVTNLGGDSVEEFAAGGAGGDISPTITISGSNTQLRFPQGLFVDTSGNVWVTGSNNKILVFEGSSLSPGNNNIPPSCIIRGRDIHNVNGIALDSQGNIYQAIFSLGQGAVNIFAPVAANCGTAVVTATRSITGSNTLIGGAFGLALSYVF